MKSCTFSPNYHPQPHSHCAVRLQLFWLLMLPLPPSRIDLIHRCHLHQNARILSAPSRVMLKTWLGLVAGPLALCLSMLPSLQTAVTEHCLMMSCTFSPNYHPEPHSHCAVRLQLFWLLTLPLPPSRIDLIHHCHLHQNARIRSAPFHVLLQTWLVLVAGPLALCLSLLPSLQTAVTEHCLMKSCTFSPNYHPQPHSHCAVPLQLPWLLLLPLPPFRIYLILHYCPNRTVQSSTAPFHVLLQTWLGLVAGPLALCVSLLLSLQTAVTEHCLMMSYSAFPNYHPPLPGCVSDDPHRSRCIQNALVPAAAAAGNVLVRTCQEISVAAAAVCRS